MNEYQEREYNLSVEESQKIQDLLPSANVQTVKKDSEGYYDGCCIKIVYKEYTFTMYNNWRDYFSAYIDDRHFNTVSSSVRGEIRKAHTINNVKTYTTKKLERYLDNEIEINAEVEDKHAENTNKYTLFLDKMRKNGVTIEKPRHDDANKWRHYGSIIKKGIEYSFKFEENGYIQEKIELDYHVKKNIDTFNLLSDNRYKV